ncbi:MAG: hypothetical protein LWX83_05260 [Anaerolineae bacterium]|nr:hypothetical protein [Anaerolineae bacterium]
MNNSIYVAMQNMIKADEPVKFYNTFRGMPVNYSGNIQRITGARVSFRVSKLQINCMVLNHGTFIKMNRVAGVVRAKVADYDLEKETVDLWGFENVINTIGYRTEVRVEANKPMGGILAVNSDVRIPTSINELSIRGLSFTFSSELFDPENFVIGRRMSMLFNIPTITSPSKNAIIFYDIELRNVIVDKSGRNIRVGARTYPDKNHENAVAGYLAHRQKELLVELRALCESKVV